LKVIVGITTLLLVHIFFPDTHFSEGRVLSGTYGAKREKAEIIGQNMTIKNKNNDSRRSLSGWDGIM
jgi:hypothetical protein